MNGEEARAVLRSQEESAQLSLRRLLLRHSREAQALADALRPWRGRSSRRRNTMRPEALAALRDSYQWVRDGGNVAPGGLRYRIAASQEVWEGWRGLLDLDYSADFSTPWAQGAPVPTGLSVEVMYSLTQQIADVCGAARVLGPVLHVPEPKHPPRHGKLPDGVLARNVAQDLADVIARGRALDRDLAAGTPVLPALRGWAESVKSSGAGFTMPWAALHDLDRGMADCGSPAVPDAAALGRAHLAVALEYLEELGERLPDYAEASGQGSRPDSVTINGKFVAIGSPVTNSQVVVAETVTSIGATVEALADRGHADVAAAIRALTEAVRQAPEFAEDQRTELLDNVADVADAAAAPDEPRTRHRARAAMAMITSAAGASSRLAEAVNTWHETVRQLF